VSILDLEEDSEAVSLLVSEEDASPAHFRAREMYREIACLATTPVPLEKLRTLLLAWVREGVGSTASPGNSCVPIPVASQRETVGAHIKF
jgi:hypothetical protein